MSVASLPAFDPRSVEALRRAARAGETQATRQAAQQFEALVLQQLLKNLRATAEAFGSEASSERRTWQELADQQLANDLARAGGLGLARVLERQWLPRQTPATPSEGEFGASTPSERRQELPTEERSLGVQTAASEERLPASREGEVIEDGEQLPEIAERSFVRERGAAPVLERSLTADRDNPLTLLLEMLGVAPPLAAASEEHLPPLVSLERDDGAASGVAAPMAERSAPLPGRVEERRGIAPVVERSISAAAGAQSASPRFGGEEDRVARFVETLWPHAQRAAGRLGVPPAFLIAQAGLETGWGRAVLKRPNGASTHNYFNLKATSDWQGESVRVRTTEYLNGRPTQEWSRFRAYSSIEEAFADYVRFLESNQRYAAARDTSDPRRFARALQQGGYATDPRYAEKLLSVIQSSRFRNAVAQASAGTALA
ncbi:MAG: flagellar assembly peptidoglycan hydrolase FlgJ [Hydrogenophilus sp.]|nr:flagellar assembly peptidoglycan hydrolase FlgJ [Hydrogenophilus sp.]